MDVQLLGPFAVQRGGRPVEIGRGRERALLALLALRAGEVVSVDRIVDALWGERPPPSAVNSVHVYVSQLRKALGEGAIATRGPGYVLALPPDAVDANRFRALLGEGSEQLRAGDPEGASRTLAEALSLWRGPALADFAYDGFAQTEIAALDELRLAALEERIEADLACGRHVSLVPELQRLVGEHPLRERLAAQLMLALYRSGRQADALAVYRLARSALDELGLEPGKALRALEQAILRQDPELDLPSRPLPRLLTRRAGGSLIAVGAALLLGALVAIALVQVLDATDGARPVAVAPNSVVVLDPRANEVVAEIPVGERPSSLVFGDGFAWVVNDDDRTISRIDAEGSYAVRTLGVDGTPTDLAPGAGALWIATAENRLLRVDPRSGRVERTIALPRPRFGARGEANRVLRADRRYVAVGAGSVWVAAYERGSVWRVHPRTGRVLATVHADAGDLAVGDTAVWMTGYLGVTALDPGSHTVREVIPLSLGEPNIALGEGFVWVAAGPVWLISPSRRAVHRSLDVGSNASAVAVADGTAWVASALDRTLARVDLESGRVVARFHLGAAPTDVAVARGRVWVAVA